MSPSRTYRSWLLPPLLAAVACVLVLGAILMGQGLQAGPREALMLGWILAFVVGLPVLLMLLAVASRLGAVWRRRHIVPFAGERIPDSGQ